MPVIGRCLLVLGLALGAAPAGAAVSVSFTAPERYTDAGYRAGDRAAVQAELARHLERLGARLLAPGQDLAIEVLDIDLAGRFEPWRRNAYDVRILREITWPRIALRYTLRAEGRVVAAADEAVSDQNYLLHAGTAGYGGDALRYEKQMLEDWFRARFGR